MILSENSSTLGSRCCSAARSETEWQRNESWNVRLLKLPPPKENMVAGEEELTDCEHAYRQTQHV